MFDLGCASHALNLLVKDIIKPSFADENGTFGDIQELCEQVTNLITLFDNTSNLHQSLTRSN
jgi:hypothetical protein